MGNTCKPMAVSFQCMTKFTTKKKKKTGAVVCSGCHNRIPQTWQPKQKKLVFSQSQRLEIQDQGADRFVSGGASLPGLQMTSLLTVSSLGLPAVLHFWCLLIRTLVLLIGPYPMTPSDLNYLLKVSFSKHWVGQNVRVFL